MNTKLISLFSSCLLLLSSINLSAQCCEYTLVLNDSYGDGWDGAYLEAYVNAEFVAQYTFTTGGSASFSFEVCNDDLVELVYYPGDYENEHSYLLFDPVWNLLFSDGPNPQTGNVFGEGAYCDADPAPGVNPCSPIILDELGCIVADNSVFPGSGINPNCSAYNNGDVWYAIQVPASGNIQISTANGGLNDTVLAAWMGEDCQGLSVVGCDDDGGNGYYSNLFLFDLEPGATIYLQVYGYGGAQGFFDLCFEDLGTVTLESSELPIIMINTLEQTIVPENKITAVMDIKYNGPGVLNQVSDPSTEYSGAIGIEIRGATSSSFPQKPYGIETRDELGENNNVPLFEMPAENDWVLLSNYNDFSLVRNILAYDLFAEMGNYSVRTRLCEVLVDSTYQGIYVFGEKIKRDDNRVSIATLLDIDNEGDELTGGYILQQNYWNNSNSFESNYSPLDHPDFDVHFVYEYPKADVITLAQKNYIASYVDSLETALYSDEFANPEVGYRKYMDVASFIDYFLINELSRNNDGFKKSVFYHKDKNSNGGKLKAGPVWDFDWAWKNMYTCSIFENEDGSGWAHLINDCPTDNYSTGWYLRLMQDPEYSNELRCTYESYRETILSTDHIFAYIDSIEVLVQNAQLRHFQKWPILGSSGFAPEIEPVANTYEEELIRLKNWISLRLEWLDENIPGLCLPSSIEEPGFAQDAFRVYPNPSTGSVTFELSEAGSEEMNLRIYNSQGVLVSEQFILAGSVRTDLFIREQGMYFYQLSGENGQIGQGKLIIAQ